jgi:hypothetical protein
MLDAMLLTSAFARLRATSFRCRPELMDDVPARHAAEQRERKEREP